jgi:ATP-dependent exoDNAse (exonuclease V) alpha subunit
MSPEEIKRREGFLARVGLSQPDRAAVIAALEKVKETLDAVANDKKMLPAGDAPAAQALRASLRNLEEQVFQDVRARLQASLTQDGFGRLNDHIRDQIKPKIKIYGEVPK